MEPLLLSLPVEVTEDILVLLAANSSPRSISALAQTCRHLRQLIYDPLDKFLWRRVFLTTFDDPRARIASQAEGKRTNITDVLFQSI